MTNFISNFRRLQPLLQRVVSSEMLTGEDEQILTNFQNSPAYDRLPKSAEAADSANKTNLFLLKQAADSLLLFAKGDNKQALQVAKATQNLKLGVDPFQGFFYRFADKIAQLVGDEKSSEVFANRYKVYREIYVLENALIGATHMFNSEVQESLSEILEEDDTAQNQLYEPVHMPLGDSQAVGVMPPIGNLTYIARSEGDQQNPKIRIFNEPRFARFVDFEAELIKIEPSHEFLEFSFELSPNETAANLLATLRSAVWTLRLIGNLEVKPLSFLGSTIKIDFSFNTIYVTLEQPKSWQELALLEEIDWVEFWFGLIAIVLIPSKS